jgi:ribosomal-protein-alanine N-acetyltransferase
MEIATARLVLREFRESDFGAVWAYQSLPESNYYHGVMPSQEDVRNTLKRAVSQAQETPRTHYHLALTIPPEDGPRGHVVLGLSYPEAREYEIGWAVDPACWGQGYATEAARGMLMLAYAYKELNAHRVVAYCKTLNVASWRVMEKLGMQREGRLREDRWWNGAWSDAFVYSILDREWAAQSNQDG